mmetsp:Transcript_9491/g.23128  ORF Transcript_9491/g.23128 Transcript_9491/m.23128 type:complete len:137 (+) Transcript_9491:496-906(+)
MDVRLAVCCTLHFESLSCLFFRLLCLGVVTLVFAADVGAPGHGGGNSFAVAVTLGFVQFAECVGEGLKSIVSISAPAREELGGGGGIRKSSSSCEVLISKLEIATPASALVLCVGEAGFVRGNGAEIVFVESHKVV